eukprot:jgi/Ulvmu1/7876/UM004_0107.1
MKHTVCQRWACALQKCLREHDYQQHECQDVIDRLYNCCETYNLFGRSPNCAGLPSKANKAEVASANDNVSK